MLEGRWPRGVTPRLRPGAAAKGTYPMPEARGCSREEQPHLQGVMSVWVQEGREELLHVQVQEGRR